MPSKLFRLSLLVSALLLVSLAAQATPLELSVRPASGVIELSPERGAQVGKIEIQNRGPEPIRIARVAPDYGSELDPRLPQEFTTGFADGSQQTVLAPGETKQVVVNWRLSPDRRLRELYGHVLIEGERGATRAIGVHGELGGSGFSLKNHLLSLVLLLPLFGLSLMAVLRVLKRSQLGNMRLLAIGVALLQLVAAGWAYSLFDSRLTRFDGNEGFQLIERGQLLQGIGMQYSLGVDGLSIGLLLVLPLVVLMAALSSQTIELRGDGHFALVLLLDLGLVGTLVALDSMLMLLTFACAVAAALMLVVLWEPRGSRRGSLGLSAAALVAVGLLAFVVNYVSRHAGTAYLVDGSLSQRVLSIPELTHVRLVIEPIFGMHPLKVLWVALFVAAALLAGAWPLHAWLPAVLARTPASIGMLLTGGLSTVTAYLFVRFAYTLLPDGTAWAGPTLAMLGALGALWGGFAACVERDLRRFAGYATLSTLGLVMVGVASRTAIGVEGAIALLIAHALTSPLLFVVAGALQDRVRTTDVSRFGGLGTELPLLALLAAVACFGSMGAPGSFGFIGQLLNLLGALPFWPAATLLAALSIVPLAGAHIRLYTRLFFGELPKSWQTSPLLEPHGGRFPALERRELLALVPAALLSVALGLWPRPALGMIEATAFDAVSRVNPPGPLQVVELEPREHDGERLAGLEPPDLAALARSASEAAGR